MRLRAEKSRGSGGGHLQTAGAGPKLGDSAVAAHPDLQAEQAHLDHAYERLEAMRAAAAALRDSVLVGNRGGTHQAREERDVLMRTSLQRLEQLELGRESLVFGRTDHAGGEIFHIGRLAVSDADQEPLVVDWRAPVAEAFYRATGRDPMGLARRRHFATRGRRIVGIEDEVFALGEGADDTGLAGPGALLAALERSRSGRMRDIVATVQREQDEVIRAPLAGVLVVQGGPGTGKTAVALHRAAYLLYTHRFPLERQGVLVVGPNPVFLRYIDQVLPSLGETGVALSTVTALAGIDPPGADSPEAARVKGDARMAAVLARAVRDRERPLRSDLVVPFGAFALRLGAAESAEVVASARRRPGTHNARRRYVEAQVFRRLHARYRAAMERSRRVGLRPPPEAAPEGADEHAAPRSDEVDLEELTDLLRQEPAVASALDRMWPRLSPAELLHDLFGAPALVALAARGVLDPEEQVALHRPRSAELDRVPWTPADAALLDEARGLLGPRRGQADETPSYGHIVVDEAQDLSPMQLRMLARRSLSGSMTVVGDVGQATGHFAPSAWDEMLRHLVRPGASTRVVELTVNYRTPAELMELAGRVLAEAAPGVRVPTSVRSTGTRPAFVEVPAQERAAEVARAARREAAALAGEGGATDGGGSVAVLVPASLVEDAERGLEAAGVAFGDALRNGLTSPVTVVATDVVKGLEFDAVVVVEPARIVAEAPQGLRALYVALTRATKRLTVVHAEPLPEAMA